MNAVIVQQVQVLDPRALPGYLRELGRYVQATDLTMHDIKLIVDDKPPLLQYGATRQVKAGSEQLFYPEGPNPAGALSAPSGLITSEEYGRITSGATLGQALYPHAFDLLERLNILRVSNLKNLATNQGIAGSYDWAYLRNTLESICNVPMSFYAEIDPPVLVGTNRVNIKIDLWANAAVHWGPNGSLWYFESRDPRAIKISTRFADSEQAALGLRDMPSIFPDARFAEKLLLRGLPKNIARMYRRIPAFNEAYWKAYWDYADGLTSKKPYFDEGLYMQMTSEAIVSHLAFLEPVFKELVIQPESIHFYDDRLNMPYNIKVESLDEIAGLIRRGYYDGDHIPTIHAVFNARQLIIQFPFLEHGIRTPVAMQIINTSGKGTLESILAGMNSTLNGNKA